jgi:hypothetical protein
MAAREHHPQLVVRERRRQEELLDHRTQRPLALDEAPDLRREAPRRAFAPEHVEGAVLRRGHQQRGGVLGDPVEAPGFERPRERLLADVLSQREVCDAEDARQGRE